MADPIADAPVIDEFAQTRGGDDLFDDEIVPVSAEEQVQAEIPVPEENIAPVESQPPPPRTDTPSRTRGNDKRGRGRGRGRGGRGAHRGRTEGAPRAKSTDKAVEREDNATEESPREAPVEALEQLTIKDETQSEVKPAETANGAEPPRVPAVRGDRSATGGLKKPKLTEEELSRRIAAAKENAAKRAAAHARAEADQASFMEREKVAEEKRRQERQNRRVMDTERERNRLRKLSALNGREWDASKREEDFNPRGGRGQFRRGMHGGVSGHARRDFEVDARAEEDGTDDRHQQYNGRGRGRGRGGRGRGGSRGARAGASGLDGTSEKPASTESTAAPVIDNDQDFPALPGNDKKEDKSVEKAAASLDKLDALSPVTGGTWADQVEAQRD